MGVKILFIICLMFMACGSNSILSNAGREIIRCQSAQGVINEPSYYGDSITWGCVNSPGNHGVPGATSEEILRVLKVCSIYEDPSEVHIMAGINNFQYDEGWRIALDIEQMIIELRGLPVVVRSVLPAEGFSYAQIQTVNAQIADKISRYSNASYVDKFETMLASGVLNGTYYSDGVHLTDQGCEAVFN